MYIFITHFFTEYV
ncbi:hypothetical protein CVH05_08260, partial [Escherichia coli]